MSRCIVNVATGTYLGGQRRLWANQFLDGFGRIHNGQLWNENAECMLMTWADMLPPGTPGGIPYAFKAFALKAAAEAGHDTLLWADASILPIAPLEPLWETIERDGAWICRNGWQNSEWTCDSAYPDLGVTREENKLVPHVVATSFGLSLAHPIGRVIYEEYLRLAQTNAFRGPWWNRNHPEYARYPHVYMGRRWCESCGPPDVRGHRHDQTALSLLAWRQGVRLTDAPKFFSYCGGEMDGTVLVADSRY